MASSSVVEPEQILRRFPGVGIRKTLKKAYTQFHISHAAKTVLIEMDMIILTVRHIYL
jgi:hypothetical protein